MVGHITRAGGKQHGRSASIELAGAVKGVSEPYNLCFPANGLVVQDACQAAPGAGWVV